MMYIMLFSNQPAAADLSSPAVETEQTVFTHLLYKYLRAKFKSRSAAKLGDAMMVTSITREICELMATL